MSCRVCGGETERFYSRPGIPTSSVALHTDRATAESQPRGDLDLDVCLNCGFIQNCSFDPGLVDYDAPYEPSQAASAVFRAFAEATIDGLVERHALRGGTLLEVGCGKAEWLAMCCRRGDMTGVGIDPAYVPGQVPEEDAGASYQVIVDRFGGGTGLTGNLIACRHTLEHLPNPVEFAGWLAEAARLTSGAVIYIEVPDTARVLDEGAFWDVYYEHCSYFTSTSLATTAAAAGIEMISLESGYSGQYLLLEGRPGGSVDLVAGGGGVASAARQFGARVRGEIEVWQERLNGGGRVALWAATSKTVGFIEATRAEPVCVVDINPVKWGSYLPGSGAAVVSPGDLASHRPDLVVAMNPIYLEEIRADLDGLGVNAELVALGALHD
jgi:hypothetical protein